jgi:signal transduction histidine kinase
LPRGGNIDLHVAKRDARVQLSVSDDGPGIGPELLEKLGQPFASETEGGTGLGILLAQSVTRQHGGELRFESEPGKGVRALLELPCGVSQPSAEPG